MTSSLINELFNFQVEACLNAIIQACTNDEDRSHNLLALCIEASRARCTVGEITDAMVKVYGRHRAADRLVSGAYRSQFSDQTEWDQVMQSVQVNLVTRVVSFVIKILLIKCF